MARDAVVITGYGIISCLGTTGDEVAASLRNGRSGIVDDDERRKWGFSSPLTGAIDDFDPKRWGLGRRQTRSMCQPALMASAATLDAMKSAGLEPDEVQSDRCGIVFGNDSTIKAAVECYERLHESRDTTMIGGGHIFRAMNSTVTMNLSMLLRTRGANWTLSGACASGAHAVGQGLMLIRSGLQDLVFVGGAQELHWSSMAAFDALGAFSQRTEDPAQASRPFDASRDGLVPSGGAAAMVLESRTHAEARGAKILATIAGYGFSSGLGEHLAEPTTEGAATAMRHALRDAELEPSEIDYINAHATSTPRGDMAENCAIADVFGPETPVSSTKSMTGHECWMAGASEVIYTMLMAREGFIAPNINFTSLAPEAPSMNVVAETIPCRIRSALSNSFGFGGTNASIILNFP